jgi:formylglycine-generating enzyme required for sulfatase activity
MNTLLTPGEIFQDRFTIIAMKGKGAFGEVYQALDTKLQRVVAIKLIPGSFLNASSHNKRRFENEIKASAAIIHEHLVTCFDAGISSHGDGFIIMEFMTGGNILDRIHDTGPIPWPDVVQQGIGLCDALQALHQRKFIHRDIKPDNIMFTGGDRAWAKIGDLGIVHVSDLDNSSTRLTQPGFQPGAVLWMAPELIEGEDPTEQSDVFALGATLFYMLTGQLHIQTPKRAHPYIVARSVVECKIIPLKSLPVDVPDELALIIEKTLQLIKTHRFASAGEFGYALRQIDQRKPIRKEMLKTVPFTTPEIVSQKAQKVVAIHKRPEVILPNKFSPQHAKAGTVYLWPKDGAEVIYVPAGPFMMGRANGLRAEKPEHQEVTGAFLIDKFPVTNARYKRFLDEVKDYPVPTGGAAWSLPFDWDPIRRTFPTGQDDYPVIMVTYDDANAFAAWAGKRLPTEAEWEKAARWDPKTNACRIFPWGDEWDTNQANSAERVSGRSFPPVFPDLAYEWYQKFRELDGLDPQEANSYELLTKVFSYPLGASALGVMDMAGNAHEWCNSEHLGLCYDGQADPAVEAADLPKIRYCRGGAWADHWYYLRTSSRYAQHGTSRYDRIGFRRAVSVLANQPKLRSPGFVL